MRNVKLSQIKRHSDPDRYVYTERVSKTSNGTYKSLHLKNKVVPLYSCPESGEHCPVLIFDKYFSKLPPQAIENDIVFVRPLEIIQNHPATPWYSGIPIGKNTLENKLRKMCALAGIEGRVTNHSMRATSVTRMYETGDPEKVIQERTGHRSLEALRVPGRVYERTNSQQHKVVSNILSSNNKQSGTFMTRNSTSATTSYDPQTSSKSISISLQNLHGCTININNNIPQTSGSTSASEFSITHEELNELFSITFNPHYAVTNLHYTSTSYHVNL